MSDPAGKLNLIMALHALSKSEQFVFTGRSECSIKLIMTAVQFDQTSS